MSESDLGLALMLSSTLTKAIHGEMSSCVGALDDLGTRIQRLQLQADGICTLISRNAWQSEQNLIENREIN
jgi:CCR4-NOT transcriptional regulation complex NOT5 subunit